MKIKLNQLFICSTHCIDPASLSATDIAELAEVYQGVTKENCYTQEMLLGYVGALEERIADLEEELKQAIK